MQNFIKKEIEKVVGKGQFDVFRPASPAGGSEKFGDYSSNVAMALNKDPKEIAEKIKSPYISKIEVAGPGFLNFWLSEKGIENGLKNIFTKPKTKKEKVQVEFISINPTGEFHIGHGRGAFYGDVLANILEMDGYKVEREFFINDSKESNQIKELGKTALRKGNIYLTENLKFKIKNLKLKTDDDGEAGYLLAKEVQKDNKKFIEKDLKIKFDKWFSEERELRQKKILKKTLDLLKKKKLVYEKDKALWLKTSKYGDEEDRVIIRSPRGEAGSSGEITYFLSDIAYHLNKFKRGYKKVIDIWGADHQGHVKRIMAVKKMLGWKGVLDILISQIVAVKEGGVLKKLSKRKGVLILLKDLIKEVGLDAARWFYLEKSLSTQMEFDMALAKERSAKNPVYYVQYAGARIYSILEKSNLKFQSASWRTNLRVKNPKIEERNLILKLIQFPEIIEDIAKDYQVHHLTTYAYELAKVFTDFYEKVPVLKAETEGLKKYRLGLIFTTREILKQVLGLLGISTPEEM